MRVLLLLDTDGAARAGIRSAVALRRDTEAASEADILHCLNELGHDVCAYAVYDDVRALLDTIGDFRPDVVVNCVEHLSGARSHEPNLAALLDMIAIPYTGSGPLALGVCKNKPLTNMVLGFHSINRARFVVSSRGRPLRALGAFPFPAFVKPADRESSDGISLASYARDSRAALARARLIHRSYDCDALIEEFVPGRDLYVGVVGTEPLTILPPAELFYRKMPSTGPRFATHHAKWSPRYRAKWGISSGAASPVPVDVRRRIEHIASVTRSALGLRGVFRLDLRLTPSGEVHVVEVNPNPPLARDDTIPRAAATVGISYPALVATLLSLASTDDTAGAARRRTKLLLRGGAASWGRRFPGRA